MIMAVSMTVLLAIIGSSFVLVSRMDRQGVRGVSDTQLTTAALDFVLRELQKVLAEDVVNNGPNGQANQLLDGGNSREPYDAPGAKDPWLAPIEPKGPTPVTWESVSSFLGSSGTTMNILAEWGSAVDADGDGIPDARLSPLLTGLDASGSSGLKIQAAVRVIDNCGMVNVNTAWKRDSGLPNNTDIQLDNRARVGDPNSYGEYPHQINLFRLLNRTGVGDAFADVVDLNEARMQNQAFMDGNVSLDLQSILYQDLCIRDYGWYGLFPAFVKNGLPYRPFGLVDEMELRNRFVINTTTDSPLEAALQKALGVYDMYSPTGAMAQTNNGGTYRLLPYFGADAAGRQKALDFWYAQLMDGIGALALSEQSNVPRAHQRQLITTYSFDRELRLTKAATTKAMPERMLADRMLDQPAGARFDINGNVVISGSPGKWRKVNLNTVLRTLAEGGTALGPIPPGSASSRYTPAEDALRRVAYAFHASGYTWDQGFQFIANLIDYIDFDDEPFVFDPDMMKTGCKPSVPIYGLERQPFIIELYGEVENQAGTMVCDRVGIELFNPYSSTIVTNGRMELWLDGGRLIELKGPDIQPFSSVIYRTDASIPAAIMDMNRIHTDGNLKLGAGGSDLLLVLMRPTAPANPIILDAIRKGKIADVLNAAGDRSMRRHVRLSIPLPSDVPTAPWGWARNDFGTVESNQGQLGSLDKIPHGSGTAGISIPVANRLPHSEGGKEYWRINGWHELSRILFIGNTDYVRWSTSYVGEPYSDVNGDGKYNRPEPFKDANGNGVYDPGEEFDDQDGNLVYSFGEPFQDLNGNFIYDLSYNDSADPRVVTEKLVDFVELDQTPRPTREDDVRFTLAAVPHSGAFHRGTALLDRLSLVSRTDDRMDNENVDGDNDPGTRFDSLMECRIPGRINVNTASEAVLKAIFPALIETTTTTLSQADLETLSIAFARAVIYLRTEGGGPFESIPQFVDRIIELDNSTIVPPIPGVPVVPKSLWYGVLVDAYLNQAANTTQSGDPYQFEDSEDREWIVSRMANLLTVRSDTFTAYILLRIDNGTEKIDRRYIATLDRSNVFLPEHLARNGWRYVDTNGDGQYDTGEPIELWDDQNGDDWIDVGEYYDSNGNGILEPDDSGDMVLFDPKGIMYGPKALNDPDYFDRQYTTPRIVALRQVPDVR
ncbi:MAG: hypothetical protein AMXMBFR13_30930 [Phycisphaerae bacterium]